MRPIINILAVIGVVIAILLTLNLYLGAMGGAFDQDEGLAIAELQLWGAVGALMAVGFGFIGRIIDRRMPRPASKISDGCIAIGVICGALIFAMPFVFG